MGEEAYADSVVLDERAGEGCKDDVWHVRRVRGGGSCSVGKTAGEKKKTNKDADACAHTAELLA